MGLIENMLQSMAGGHGVTTPMLVSALRGVTGGGDSPGPGIAWVLEKLTAAGLGEQVASWSGRAPRPISGAQLREALGADEVTAMATRAGLSEDELVAKLSEHLPGVVQELARMSAATEAAARPRAG